MIQAELRSRPGGGSSTTKEPRPYNVAAQSRAGILRRQKSPVPTTLSHKAGRGFFDDKRAPSLQRCRTKAGGGSSTTKEPRPYNVAAQNRAGVLRRQKNPVPTTLSHKAGRGFFDDKRAPSLQRCRTKPGGDKPRPYGITARLRHYRTVTALPHGYGIVARLRHCRAVLG